MKVFLLITGSGPLVIATSHESLQDEALIKKLESKGIFKFIGHEMPLDLVKERYHGHFEIAAQDLHEMDDLRVLDYNGERAFQLFKFSELGPEIMHEPEGYTERFTYPRKQ
ncbi:MAG: hypothetical protein QNJ56_08245 [Gammaproteobacteria bacterium]|nr:hypothetical protein [Gammaproteobacteria bacterium]